MFGKSMKVNAILNGIKTMLSIIFPLITFPYAARVLQVENLGKVNFSSSVVTYFTLLAALGVSTYAIREGSGEKNDNNKFNEFASQVFTINVISTFAAYLALFFLILLVPSLGEYKILLFIQSSTLIFNTIGVEWVYSIYEDYAYLTIRSLIFQLVSMLLLFLLVKDINDYYIYTIITVFSNVGSNLLNYLHSKTYCKIKLTKKLNLKKHLKPIFIIFSTSIATTIYVNSDLTMLGVMVGDHAVGLYSVSTKVYSVLKTVLSAVIIVSVPRLSFYLSNDMGKKYTNTITKIFNSLSLLMFPTVVGINLLCNQIVMIIAGVNYTEATISLRILSIALVFSTFASFTTASVLLPIKKEKYILMATIASALVNVILNLFLIPMFQQNGAAITTAIAELLVFLISYYHARKFIKIDGVVKNLATSIIGCLAMILLSGILKLFVANMTLYTVFTMVGSTVVYLMVLLLLKNNLAIELLNGIIKKFEN